MYVTDWVFDVSKHVFDNDICRMTEADVREFVLLYSYEYEMIKHMR